MRMETVSRLFHRGVEKIKNATIPFILIVLTGPVLCGCVTTHASAPLVPPPPQVVDRTDERHDGSLMMAVFFAEYTPHYAHNFVPPAAEQEAGIPLGAVARPELAGLPQGLGYERERVVLSAKAAEQNCSIGDRFDRGEVIAYEWDRSRLGVDVDGVSMGGGSDDDAVRLTYTLRLQPEKSDQQRCRYASAWQGIAGSAYNELVKRDQNTVWDQLRQIRKDVQNMF